MACGLVGPIPRPKGAISVRHKGKSSIRFQRARTRIGRVFFHSFRIRFINSSRPKLFNRIFTMRFGFHTRVLGIFGKITTFTTNRIRGRSRRFTTHSITRRFVSRTPIIIYTFGSTKGIHRGTTTGTIRFRRSGSELGHNGEVTNCFKLNFQGISRRYTFTHIKMTCRPNIHGTTRFRGRSSFLPLHSRLNFHEHLINHKARVPISLTTRTTLTRHRPNTSFHRVHCFFRFGTFAFPFRPNHLHRKENVTTMSGNTKKRFPSSKFTILTVFLNTLSTCPVHNSWF